MKFSSAISYLIPATTALALTTSCSHKSTSVAEATVVYNPTEASGFKIEQLPDMESTIITTTNPWQGATNVNSQLLLLHEGETTPDTFSGTVIDWPARRIIAMSTTTVAMLDALDATDHIAGVSGLRFLSSENIDPRRIADVGNEANADFERIVSLDPDLVIIYGIASPSSMEAKLKSLGIPYFYVGDYLEQSPLGKAEWMVAIGEIIGHRDKAITQFAEIRESYNNLKSKVDTSGQRPLVMLNAPYTDAWFLPSADSYLVKLIEDAGGKYVFDSNTSGKTIAVADETALQLASQADLWLCPGSYQSLDVMKREMPTFASVKAIKNHQVWNNTLRINAYGGNDFYEAATVNPQQVLEDLIEIINPGSESDQYEPHYFMKLK